MENKRTDLFELLQLEGSVIHRFRRALRRSDQLVLDDLLAAVQPHLPAVAISARTSMIESILLVMLLEEHKLVIRLWSQLHDLTSKNDLLVQ